MFPQKVKDHPNPHQLYEQRLIKEGTINEEQVRSGSRKQEAAPAMHNTPASVHRCCLELHSADTGWCTSSGTATCTGPAHTRRCCMGSATRPARTSRAAAP